MPKIFRRFGKTGPEIFSILVPSIRTRYRLKAIACGGDGGAANGLRGGGGGGAGNFLDIEVFIRPDTIITCLANTTFFYLSYENEVGQLQNIILKNGANGSAATIANPGNGGDSGAGGEGGTQASVEARIPTGFIDGDGLIHTTGGFGGIGGTLPPTINIDYAYSRGFSGNLQRYKLKFPCADDLAIGQGGFGGCSYFDKPGSAGEGGLGSGGSGESAGGVGVGFPGGDGFVSLEWG